MTKISSPTSSDSMIASFSRVVSSRRLYAGAAALGLLALGSCSTNDILEVDQPGIIDLSNAATPAAATFLRNGAIQSFVSGFDGGGDAFIIATGNLADEFRASDTFDGRLLPNRRLMNDNLPEMTSTYIALQKSRSDLTTAEKTLLVVAPTQKYLAAEMLMYRGFTEDFFGEMYCSGVPFSTTNDDGSFNFAAPLTTVQIWAKSIATFDSALALADTSQRVKNAAAIGKARALMNAGDYAGAATAVAAVATTFKLVSDHCNCTKGTENGAYGAASGASSRYTPSSGEGVNGLIFLPPAHDDPRLPWVATTRSGFNAIFTNMPIALKICPSYRDAKGIPCAASPNTTGEVVIASGIEARLIEAEALLKSGGDTPANRTAVTALLNVLRHTTTPVLADLVAPATNTAMVTLLFQERAFWMSYTGHRLGDMRRLIRQYGRDAETVFPTGEQQAPLTGPYGSDVNFPVPAQEKNNPLFTGCIDRKA